MHMRLLAAILLALSLACPVLAARNLPADAELGTLSQVDYPNVQIGKKTFRLAPGVLIYDQSNRTILYDRLNGGEVLYRLDLMGLVSGLWLLTPEEATALKQDKKK